MTGMRKFRTWWRQLVFMSVSRVRPSREIPAKHSVLLNYHIWYTLSLPTLFIPPITHRCWGVLLRENPSHNPWELEIVIPTILYIIDCGFSSTPISPFLYPWEVDSPKIYHTHFECQVRFWCYWKALEEAKFWQKDSQDTVPRSLIGVGA